MIELTLTEKDLIEKLDTFYTPDYVEEWINRNDNVETNPVSALMSTGAKGFYEAIKAMVKLEMWG